MHLKKIEEKINRLDNLTLKVNNDRNIFIIQFMKINQQLSFFANNALMNKKIITAMQKQYSIKNDLLEANNFVSKLFAWRKKSKKILWIYITEEQKYATDSYSRYEETILKNNTKQDDFIVIGNHANEFCTKNKLNVLKYFENNKKNQNLSNNLVSIIKTLFATGNYSNVRFVINSNKNYNGFFTILPINQFDIDKLISNNYDDNKSFLNFNEFKIYPNINDFINTEINIFLYNTINALICESSFYSAKIGLVSTNKIIKQIDESKYKLKKQLNRIKSELEIEEITLLTRNNKLN
ncbi:MSC_0622 family F1-like ATPase gamma subunit [Mycoplasmopsis primatum]|uniref:MSC_0622 family F1-like ATPase gamma subunit n=1 Tax=Mycoplasmopsis primatum TaxID=55604 RepID=UPI000495ACFB|nr:hypothetical protein [Mycoplasmopsis primatum]